MLLHLKLLSRRAFSAARTKRAAMSASFAALICTNAALAQQIVDPAAPIQFRPRVGVSGNGTPLVDIARPSFGGVSHNKFQRYDVDQRGVILNNSGLGGTSVIGGAVGANPNLAGSPAARVIINEVTSAARSTLNGPTEVFGQKADVIVANPNGVVCSGCGFINAGRVTLTTGVPIPDYDTGAVSFSVTRGTVEISGAGVSGAAGQSLRAIDLVARQLSIQGTVAASDEVRLRAGSGTYDQTADRWTATTPSVAFAGPAIQSSSAGAISAGTISAISSDVDLGVVLDGPLTALTGPLSVKSAGEARLAATNVVGDLSVSASGVVTLTGVHKALGRITLDGAHVVVETGADVAANDSVLVSALQSLVTRGTLRSGQSIALVSQGTLLATGVIAAQGQVILQARDLATTDLSLAAGGDARLVGVERASLANTQIGAGGDVRVSAPAIELGAGALFQSPGVIAIDARDSLVNNTTLAYPNLELSVLGSYASGAGSALVEDALLLNLRDGVDNAGLLAGRVSVDLTAQSLINRDSGVVAGPMVEINLSTDLTNLGRILSDTTLDLVARDVLNRGTIAANGDLTLQARSYLADSPAAQLAARNAQIIIAGGVDNQGQIVAGDALALQTGALANRSSGAIGASAASLTTTGDLLNEGQIAARNALIATAGGFLTNSGVLSSTAATQLAAAGLANVGEISGVTVAISAGGMSNSGENARVLGEAVTLRLSGHLSNGGLIQASADLSIRAANLRNDALAQSSDGGYVGLMRGARVAISLSGDLVNAGAILSGGDLALTAVNLVNGGEMSGNGRLLAQLSGDVLNQGRILAGDALGLAARSYAGLAQARAQGLDVSMALTGVFDDAGVILALRDADIAAGAIRNRGSASEISAAGTLTLLSRSDIVNDGLIGAASLGLEANGDLLNAGAIQAGAGPLSLAVGGALSNSGLIQGSGDLTLAANAVTNAAGAQISARLAQLRIVGALANDGALIGQDSLTVAAGSVANGAFVASTSAGLIASRRLDFTVLGALSNTGLMSGQDVVSIRSGALNDAGEVSGANVSATVSGAASIAGRLIATAGLSLTSGSLDVLTGANVHGDEVTISSTNAFANAGIIDAVSGLGLTAGSASNGGRIQSAADARLSIVSDMTNAGALVVGKDALLMIGGSLTSPGAISAGGNLTLRVGGQVASGGLLRAVGALDLESAGYASLSSDSVVAGRTVAARLTGAMSNLGLIVAEGDMSLNAAALENGQYGVTASGQSFGLLAAQSLDVTVAGAVVNRGVINTTNGHLFLTAASLDNSGRVNAAGDLTLVASGLVANSGQIGATGAFDAQIGSYAATAGAQLLAAQARLSLTGDFANAGDVSVSNRLQLSSVAAFSNSGTIEASGVAIAAGAASNAGAIRASGSIAMSFASLANAGAIAAGRTLSLVIASDLSNSGQLQAGQALAVAAGSLSNAASGALDATAIFIQAGALTNAGSIVATESLQIAAASLFNAGVTQTATISANALSLTIDGAIVNGPNALIQAQTGSSVSASSYSAGFLSNRAIRDGLFSFGRNLDMSVTQGGWTFSSDLIVGGDLSFRAQGDIVNSSTIAAGGALALTSVEGSILNGAAATSGSASSSFRVLTPLEAQSLISYRGALEPAFPTTYLEVGGHVLSVATGAYEITTGVDNRGTIPVGGEVKIASGPLGTVVAQGSNFTVNDYSATCYDVVSCAQTSVIVLSTGAGPSPISGLPSGVIAASVPITGPGVWEVLNARLGGRLQPGGYVLLQQLADGTYAFAPTAAQPTDTASTPASQIYSGGAMSLTASADVVNASAFIQSNAGLSINAGRDLVNSRVSGSGWSLTQTANVVSVRGTGVDAMQTFEATAVMSAGSQAQGVGALAAQGSAAITTGGSVRNEAGLLTTGGDLVISTARYVNAAATNNVYASRATWTYGNSGPDGVTNDFIYVRQPQSVDILSSPGSETGSSVYVAGSLRIAASQSYLNTGSEVANGVSVHAPSITVGVINPNVFSPPARLPASSVNLGYFLSSSAPGVVGPAAINGAYDPASATAAAQVGWASAKATSASTVEASLSAPLPPPNPRSVSLPGLPGRPDVSVTYLYNAPIPSSSSRDPSWILTQVGDARSNLSVFADPQTEQRLIQQALVSSIGKAMLDPTYKDPAGQQAALYQGAVDFLKANPTIHLGERLTEAQRAGVSKPMLWYNEQDVGGVKTLVPELVLPTSMLATYAAPTGGSISATNISLVGDNVTNAGTIVARDALIVSAGAFLNQARLTQQPSEWALAAVSGFSSAVHGAPAIATMGGTIGADTLSIIADRGVANIGGSITAGSSAQIASLQGDVINDALSNMSRTTLARGLLSQAPMVVGGSIMSGGSLDIAAQGRLVNTASSINAFGDVDIYAGAGIVQQALTTSYLSEYSDAGGALTFKTREVYSPLVFGASIASLGGDVYLTTRGDIVFNGGRAQAAGSLSASAANIELNSIVAEGLYKETKSGFHGLSYSSVTTKGNLIAVAQAGMIAGDSLTLKAANDVRGVGALVAAGGDATIAAGNDIVFDALTNNYWRTTKGWSLGLSNPIISGVTAAEKVLAGQGGAAGAAWSSLKMLAGMKAAGTANNVTVSPLTAGLWQNLTSATLSFNSFSSRKDWTQSEVSQLTAGGDLTLSAGHDVALIGGTQALAGRDAALIAGNDVRLEAALDTMRSKSSNRGASIGYSAGGVTLGVSTGGSKSSSDSYINASLRSGRDTTIVAGRDVAVLGGKIAAGGDLYLDAGRDLTLATLLDRSSSNSWSVNASVTLSPTPTGASIGGSVGKGSGLWANDVTTITANGVLDARVGGATTLTGAGMWSTSNQLALETARFVATDLAERNASWSVHGGLSFGLGPAFSLAGVSGNVGASYANKEGVILATLGQGAITVRAGADLSALNRDPAAMRQTTSDDKFSFEIPEINPLIIQHTVKDAANYVSALLTATPDDIVAAGPQAVRQFQTLLLRGATLEQAQSLAATPEYQNLLRLRNEFDRRQVDPNASGPTPDALALAILQGEDAYWDASRGTYVIRSSCTMGAGAPCEYLVSAQKLATAYTREDVDRFYGSLMAKLGKGDYSAQDERDANQALMCLMYVTAKEGDYASVASLATTIAQARDADAKTALSSAYNLQRTALVDFVRQEKGDIEAAKLYFSTPRINWESDNSFAAIGVATVYHTFNGILKYSASSKAVGVIPGQDGAEPTYLMYDSSRGVYFLFNKVDTAVETSMNIAMLLTTGAVGPVDEAVLASNPNKLLLSDLTNATRSSKSIPFITPSSLPVAEEAALLDTLRLIDSGTVPTSPLSKKWGTPFKNYEGSLPGGQGSASPYLEYRVAPSNGQVGAGTNRVVINSLTGETYFTWTHYGDAGAPSFVRIR